MPRPIVAHAICDGCGFENPFGAPHCSRCGASLHTLVGAVETAEIPALEADPEVVEVWHRLRDATLGAYDIYAPIGRGGMATVFLALDLALEREVAIKVISPGIVQTKSLVERFKREARIAASLSHPNIIPVFAVQEFDGLAFFIMKYVEGRSLESIIREQGSLSLDITVDVLRQVGDALDFAHRKGVVHRDVKSANIMIDQDGWAIVTDFGIAKVADAGSLTSAGVVVGTPAYMSPEQFSGGDITGAADQYSLGIVTYEMLTGRTPFCAATIADMMRSHMMDEPESLVKVRPDIPRAFSDVVLRMLAKQPADRWPTIGDAAEVVETLSQSHQEAARSAMMVLARSGSSERPRVSVPISPSPSRVRERSAAKRRSQSRWRRNLPTVAAAVLVVGGIAWATFRARSPSLVVRNAPVATDSGTRTARKRAPDSVQAATVAANASSTSAPIESTKKRSPGKTLATTHRSPAPRTESVSKVAAVPVRDTTPLMVERSHGVELTPAPPPAAVVPPEPSIPSQGFVLIGSRIPTAILFLNGVASGVIGPLKVLAVPPGKLRIGVRAERCQPWDSTIIVPVNDTAHLNYRNPTCPP